MNVAIYNYNLALAYRKKAKRFCKTNDLDIVVANLESALHLFGEAARIYRAINYDKDADDAVRDTAKIEEALRQCSIARGTAEAATNG